MISGRCYVEWFKFFFRLVIGGCKKWREDRILGGDRCELLCSNVRGSVEFMWEGEEGEWWNCWYRGFL